MWGRRYWLKDEENVCRVCRGEGENWEHILERCMRGFGGGEKERIEGRVRRLLAGDGTGEEWLKELEMMRRRGEGERVRERRREEERGGGGGRGRGGRES